MQAGEENNKTTEFSSLLSRSFDWFDKTFTPVLADAFSEFWGVCADVKLLSISENTNLLAECDEFFVTQIRINRELSVFIRLSKQIVRSLLEKILGVNGTIFNIEKITDLEAKILTGFDDFVYQSISQFIKKGQELPEQNTNYNECNLTYFLKINGFSLGKIVVKIPVIALTPEVLEQAASGFDITNFSSASATVKLIAGSTRVRLNEIKQLEPDDIILLEQSSSSRMTLRYKDYETIVCVKPNPAIMIDCDGFDDNNHTPKGDKAMTGNDIYNMWDSIQVDVNAEFEKVKLTLGELKQISEGLVVDIGSVYDNRIDLKVEDKIVASGELIIINDRYGVKINKIFTEEKNQASENYQTENDYYASDNFDEQEPSYESEQSYQSDASETQYNTDSDMDDEDFDYSNFDVDEDDL